MSQPYDPNQPPSGYPPANNPQNPQPQYPQNPAPSQPQYPAPSQPYPQPPPYGQPPAPSQPYTPPPAQPYPGYPPASQPYPGYPPASQPYPGYAPPSQPQYPPASQPYAPTTPNYGDVPPGSQPYTGAPPQPWPAPSQPYTGAPSQGWPAPVAVATEARPTSSGLPGWGLPVALGAVVLILIALFLTGSDWAAGGLHAGILAAVAGLAALTYAAVRAAGKQMTSQVIGLGLVGVILVALGGAGIAFQMPLHTAQASSLEAQGQWQRAIDEYALGGATAPGSEDIARIYNEWGEQESGNGQYQAAIGNFDTVITSYTAATTGVARAKKDEASAYLGEGEQALQSGDYTSAVQAFQKVTTSQLSATDASKLHTDYAKALLGEGQAQLNGGSCQNALTIYQQLAQQFADTASGQTASTALKAPQAVQGQFTGAITPPSGDIPVALLGQNFKVNVQAQTVKGTLIAAALIQSDGTFTFKPVKLATYDFLWGFVDSSTKQLVGVVIPIDSAGNPTLVFTMLPLCTNVLPALDTGVHARFLTQVHLGAFTVDAPTDLVSKATVRVAFTR